MFKEVKTFDPERVCSPAEEHFDAKEEHRMLEQGLSLEEIANRRRQAEDIAIKIEAQVASVRAYLEDQGLNSIYELPLDDKVRIAAEWLMGGNE